ncbi:hypothetical protein EW145_g2789 [Phellinidium pouzarii]|uniref:D-aminoacyl-tRNA deacylase n=1 Tax=Phellinidium pouzarii TaxID=167371 RepID=A0A4S4LBH5_9AGAM|nr:hypothetical protein EW145_g2789 [Phellinidium pouzarii]
MWKKSVKDIDGEILCVSQFTLMANTAKGNKPDFHRAMREDQSRQLYASLLTRLGNIYLPEKIKDGRFGAMMNVSLTNDGPVTFTLDSRKLELGNNDVIEKVAQETSCLQPKQFKAALNTVRSALASYLQKRQQRVDSYQSLCREFGLSDDALYWMEETEKVLRKTDALDNLDAADETVMYMVFYWTCIALNIRSVKRATIMSDYGVNLRDFQALEEALDTTCQDVRESIDKFVSENRTARSAHSSSVNSPTKTPTKTRHLPPGGSPLKRKSHLPLFPPVSPVKRPRVASPTKLNRLPVTTNVTPNRNAAFTSTPSPVKTYAASMSIMASPTKTIEVLSESPRKETQTPPVVPITPVKAATARVTRPAPMDGKASSPRKSLRMQSPGGDSLTPTRQRRRGRPSRLPSPPAVNVDIEMGNPQETDVESAEPSDDGNPPPSCRHRLPVFSDRSFYRYRDPRVLREWEAAPSQQARILSHLRLNALADHATAITENGLPLAMSLHQHNHNPYAYGASVMQHYMPAQGTAQQPVPAPHQPQPQSQQQPSTPGSAGTVAPGETYSQQAGGQNQQAPLVAQGDWTKNLVHLAKTAELKKHALTLQLHTAHILSAQSSLDAKNKALQEIKTQKSLLENERNRLLQNLSKTDLAETSINKECVELRAKIQAITEGEYAGAKREVDMLRAELGQPPVPSLQQAMEEKNATYLNERRLNGPPEVVESLPPTPVAVKRTATESSGAEMPAKTSAWASEGQQEPE